MPTTYEQTKRGYVNLWRAATLQSAKEASVVRTARKFFDTRARYAAVEKLTGVPDWWIFCVHIRESGGNFAGVLHNGEHIIGTGRKTRLVPEGRGPFTSWEQAAVDALKIKGLDKITDWNVSRVLYEFERFNGFGYYGPGVNSPYVWADTSLEQTGKYTSDHHFDRSFDDPQTGCAALLKVLCKLDSAIDAKVNGNIPPPAPKPLVKPLPSPAEKPKPSRTAETVTTTAVIVAGGVAAKQAHDAGHGPGRIALIVLAVVVVAIGAFISVRWIRRKT